MRERKSTWVPIFTINKGNDSKNRKLITRLILVSDAGDELNEAIVRTQCFGHETKLTKTQQKAMLSEADEG